LLKEFQPEIIGIRTLTYYREFFHKTVALVRSRGIKTLVIAGGPYATGSYDTILQDRNVDLAVLGEGEVTFTQLVGKMLENKNRLPDEAVLAGIPGLAFIPGRNKAKAFSREIIFMEEVSLSGDIKNKNPGRDIIKQRHRHHPGNPAYVMFTSGTTGRPKGVVIEHQNVVNLLSWFGKTYNLGPGTHVMQLTDYTFDPSVEDIFGTLLHGGTLYTADKNTVLARDAFRRYVDTRQVHIIDFVPTALNELLGDGEKLASLRAVICGGERLEESIKDRILQKGYKLHNHYGPTEITVDALVSTCGPGSVTIGRPISNVRCFILDKKHRPAPTGAAGELCIAGAGLSRGYLNSPELTARKFDRDLWDLQDCQDEKQKAPGKRFYRSHKSHRSYIYKSGDLARWHADGNIEFLGRIDLQVKIRGFRIEPGEIESQLLQKQEIEETVVVAKENEAGQKCLCAYVISGSEVNVSELKEWLSKKIPGYMIPSYFIQVEKIPLTSNGKVNRSQLASPGNRAADGYLPPGSSIERKLVDIWREALGVERIGITDNFFEIGGDSIKAIQVAARLKKYRLELKINDLFLHPTIKDLGKYVKEGKKIRTGEQGIVKGKIPLTPIQEWFFNQNFTHRHHYNHAVMLYRERGIREILVRELFNKIAAHHDALRIVYRFDGSKNNIVQWNRGLDEPLYDLRVMQLKDKPEPGIESEILKAANRIQRSIDLEKGPLLKLGLFKTNRGDHLLLVLHHLVVDGVSWRILLEDIAAGYRQLEQGQDMVFPGKTNSFQYWSQKQVEYSRGETLLNQLEYWRSVEETRVRELPKDFEVTAKEKVSGSSEIISIHLDEENTAALLKEVNQAYSTGINDILLTALGMAIKEWKGLGKIAVNLEGHGRESIIEDIDINRTVGWFTSQFPLVLDMSHREDLAYMIKSVKETLRKIPQKGIGWGILRYLTPPGKKKGTNFAIEPEINFNYLGQFEQKKETRERGIDIFTFSRIGTGDTVSPLMERTHALDINGMVTGRKLKVTFSFSRYEFMKTTMEKLVDCFRRRLIEIIEHCAAKKEKELTPADMDYSKQLTIDQLEELEDRFSKIDIG
jgi:amino acid adenylation domain-containing protein/non-ribosomal peptide synthase protein (TIGR01720 family)